MNNPILEELYAAREKLLPDVGGDPSKYLEGVRERERDNLWPRAIRQRIPFKTANCLTSSCESFRTMIDTVSSKDTSDHIDRLIQLGRQAVHDAQQQSRELGVSNVYSMGGKLYYELPSGELSLTQPPPAN